ncbi:DUF2087 domain-containing protein [Niallia sp.]|uniref:DUF2087 domain-containing protein n=1 Tax=Niallia sp. TaxID=2837523 RepID=UPI0028A17D86|nr:DUF2087 domain-containing protein [Niallia sp.]
MDVSSIFQNATIEELKKGYIEESDSYLCLLCGEQIEKGVIYPQDGKLYEAEKFMKLHIEGVHQSVFHYLISLDKKMTGLTEHQTKLLELFYQGKSDAEVKKELEIGSASTIRHHRFALKEKERQARNFLAIMELLKEKDNHAPSFVPVHQTATMVDDRYNITEEEQVEVAAKYFKDGVLSKFPIKQKQKLMVLREIANRLEEQESFSEKELNQLLMTIYEDYVLIRRYLIEYGFLDRKADGSLYWLKK